MCTQDVNKYILKTDVNQETKKYFWEIHLNGNVILKSDREYNTESDCHLHLMSLANAFRYLCADKQIKI